jgi:hypothetical protein
MIEMDFKQIKIKDDEKYEDNILKCSQILINQNKINDNDLGKICVYIRELLRIDHFRYMYRIIG